MALSRTLLAVTLAGASLLAAGCGGHTRVVAYGPPPPVPSQDRVARIASDNGFRDGRQQGRFDAEHGRRPEPRRDSMYRSFPGWAAELGDRGLYRDFYQAAFLRGYNEAYNRH